MEGNNSFEEETQKLQTKVDKIKTLSLISNAHNMGSNLTPPPKRNDEEINEIAIIRALDQHPQIKAIYFEARGIIQDAKGNLIQISTPLVNVRGAWKLVATLKKFETASWSNFDQERIPYYIDHFFRENYPYFTFWHEEYDLDPRDFDYVKTTLQMFLLSCFYKAKGGKQLNIVGKTYSEDFMGRILKDENNQKKREGFLERMNPFKKIGANG